MKRIFYLLSFGLFLTLSACQQDQTLAPDLTAGQLHSGARTAVDPATTLENNIQPYRGNNPLKHDAQLSTYALQLAQDIVNKGLTLPASISAVQKLYQYEGSLTSANSDPVAVVQSWIGDPNKAVVLLSNNYQRIGVGYAKRTDGRLVWILLLEGGDFLVKSTTPTTPTQPAVKYPDYSFDFPPNKALDKLFHSYPDYSQAQLLPIGAPVYCPPIGKVVAVDLNSFATEKYILYFAYDIHTNLLLHYDYSSKSYVPHYVDGALFYVK
ncbi:hypothetical protein GCM10028805_52650 [Spirosoma harenae]